MAQQRKCDFCKEVYWDKREDREINLIYKEVEVKVYVSLEAGSDKYHTMDACEDCRKAVQELALGN